MASLLLEWRFWRTSAPYVSSIRISCSGLRSYSCSASRPLSSSIQEVLFYLYESVRFERINSSPNIRADLKRMRRAMDSFLDLAEIVDLQEFIEGWFMNLTPIEEIKHDNMVEFIAYGFYSKDLDSLTDEERGEIDEFMSKVCRAFKQKAFEPGGYRKLFLGRSE